MTLTVCSVVWSVWWPMTVYIMYCNIVNHVFLLAAKDIELEALAGEMKALKQVQLAKDKAIALVRHYSSTNIKTSCVNMASATRGSCKGLHGW